VFISENKYGMHFNGSSMLSLDSEMLILQEIQKNKGSFAAPHGKTI
jgi:hypothetical protein